MKRITWKRIKPTRREKIIRYRATWDKVTIGELRLRTNKDFAKYEGVYHLSDKYKTFSDLAVGKQWIMGCHAQWLAKVAARLDDNRMTVKDMWHCDV